MMASPHHGSLTVCGERTGHPTRCAVQEGMGTTLISPLRAHQRSCSVWCHHRHNTPNPPEAGLRIDDGIDIPTTGMGATPLRRGNWNTAAAVVQVRAGCGYCVCPYQAHRQVVRR